MSKMRHPKCPTCKKPVEPVLVQGVPRASEWSPFCSERCKLVDLQKWLGGVYAIPGAPLSDDVVERTDETKLDEDP